MSPRPSKSDREARALAAAAHARRTTHRSRFGWAGTEPPEGRQPLQRWGAQACAFAGLIAVALGAVEVGAAFALVGLVLGVPRAWTWANDRASSMLWSVAVGLLVAAEVTYASGDSAARRGFGAHGGAGSAALLVFACTVALLIVTFRRWGTAGNVAYTSRQLSHRDPVAMSAVRERDERAGRTPHDPD
jgi:hypothetical protein